MAKEKIENLALVEIRDLARRLNQNHEEIEKAKNEKEILKLLIGTLESEGRELRSKHIEAKRRSERLVDSIIESDDENIIELFNQAILAAKLIED